MPWYESWNAPHARDAIFVAETTSIMQHLVYETPRGRAISIGTGQGGLVPYMWANEFPGRLNFIDRDNILTKDFLTCPGLESGPNGLVISYADWFAHAGACAPRLPDLVFGVLSMSAYPGLSHYYHLVYYQDLLMRRSGIQPIVFNAQMFLAVRNGWNRTIPFVTKTVSRSHL